MDEIYRHWASVAIDEDSEGEDDGVSGVDPPGSARGMMVVAGLPGSDSEESDAEQLGASLGGMSISPTRDINMSS